MFKKIVLAEMKKRNMTINGLSVASNVQRDAVYRWLNNTNISIHSITLEQILDSLEIVVVPAVELKDRNEVLDGR